MANYLYQCTECGAVTERTYPVGGSPPFLSDACESCTQFTSEHRRLTSAAPRPPSPPGLTSPCGPGPPALRTLGR